MRVNSEIGTIRKSVVKILRSKVTPKLLEKLDACKLIFDAIEIIVIATSLLVCSGCPADVCATRFLGTTSTLADPVSGCQS